MAEVKYEDIIKERAAYNTAHNKKHGIKQVCDGLCATDECVCDMPGGGVAGDE